MTATPPAMLPGNLLTPADSDFENGSLTGFWATTNCTLAIIAGTPLSGPHCLKVTATTTGNVTIMANTPLAGFPKTGYVLSGYGTATNPGRAVQPGESWFTAGNTFISSVTGTSTSMPANVWAPFQGAMSSPATTGLQYPFITITGMTAGELFYLDLLYVAPSLVQVLIAWQTPPLSTSPLFADMTPFTRADQSISLTRGRPDETATVQAGNATLTLDNTVWPGAFSQGNANSPFSIQVSRRMQVNFADETGAWHTRFDGTITDIEPAWQGGPGLEGTVAITANGLIGWLARNPGPTLSVLRSLIEEEQLADGPLVQIPMSERAGSSTAADESGNSAPALVRASWGTTGNFDTLVFGGSGIIGFAANGFSASILTAAKWTPQNSGTPMTGGQVLTGSLPTPLPAPAGFTAELWYQFNTANAGPCIAMCLASRNDKSYVFVWAGSSNWFLGYYKNSSSITLSSAFVPASTGQMVVTVSGTTASIYFNGSATATATITIPSYTFAEVTLGALTASTAPSAGLGGWDGQLSCFAVYSSVLSAGRISAHWTAGSVQNQGQLISTLITNTLTYAGIPAAFINVPSSGGVSYADPYDATGQNPLAMIQLYQQTDWGVFYEAANGQLTWQDRAARYGLQVTPALVLTGGQYEPSFTFPLTTQYLINDANFANNNFPNGIRALNTASVTQNGTYANGTSAGSQFTSTAAPSSLTTTTAGSPLTGPWYSYPHQPSTTPVPDVLNDAVNWQVNIYGTPVPRSPSLEIDLASALGTGTQVSRAAVLACDIGSVIELTGLPPTSPAGTRVAYLMVEGVDESFQRDDSSGITWTLTFNTSPASQSAAWIAGDANLGVLDSTAVVGLGTDGNFNGSFEYTGQPYVVPTFSGTLNRTGSVGANDMRGLTANTSLQVNAPCATVQQVTLAQSIANTTNTLVQFDNVWYDNSPNGGGWKIPANATTYTVPFPGVYLLTATVVFAANASGLRQAWFTRNGTIVGISTQAQPFGTPIGVPVTQQVQCAQGDTLQLWCLQTSGGALGLTTTSGGPVFSVLWLGM